MKKLIFKYSIIGLLIWFSVSLLIYKYRLNTDGYEPFFIGALFVVFFLLEYIVLITKMICYELGFEPNFESSHESKCNIISTKIQMVENVSIVLLSWFSGSFVIYKTFKSKTSIEMAIIAGFVCISMSKEERIIKITERICSKSCFKLKNNISDDSYRKNIMATVLAIIVSIVLIYSLIYEKINLVWVK
ncbi:MAG: hypothetical protein ACOYL3_15690 [Desulfuromonadaceae bacterium]